MAFKWWAVKLAAVCIVVFVLQALFPFITEGFALVSADLLARPWILLTHIFLHGSMEHLLYNMFALALFGSILEKIISSKRFLVLFFISGLFAGIGSAIFYPASIGASGAIFGVLGCLTILRPRMTVWVGMVPMPLAVAAFVWAAGDLIGMFAPGQIANAAHLFGLGFGLIVGLKMRKRFGEIKIKGSKSEISDTQFKQWEDEWMK